MSFKKMVTAQLNEKEWALLEKAQEKYITDGKGSASIRTILLLGVYSLIGLDVETNT